MPPKTPEAPLDYQLLKSRFDGAHLVRVDDQSRMIAVWNGSETINLYTYSLDEVQEGPHTVPGDKHGNPVSRDEIEEHIETIFQDYR